MLNMERRMCDLSFCYVIILFTLFELIVETKMSVHDNSHDFIQTNNEVRYIVDGVPVSMHKELHGASGVRMSHLEDNSLYEYNPNTYLKFEPPLLDFKERHLGIPHHEKVTLFNINKNQTIHMSSISGNTVHFHSSFFEDKIIPPLGNTTFNVVFLGREEGEIESSLFIHTSEGSFKYGVKGSSVSSPYRLRPLVGARVPLNSSYSPLVYMYNPHPTPIQIVEIYSSGGDFHLELPSGELEGPKHLWEIPPFHTKPVIRVRFVANSEKNHTAYIRIKVNNSEEVLVVPMEVEVTSNQGLYFPENMLDFGFGGSLEKPKQIKLLLYNSMKKPIRIQNIITTPVSKVVDISFEPVKVPPDSKIPTEVATLTFDWKTAFDTMHFSGKLIVKSNQSQHKLIIPYMAQVLEGSLSFNASVTQYCSDLGPNLDVRNFTITNNYQVPVAITEITLPKEAEAHFLIQNFTAQTVLKPGETVTLFRLTFKREAVEADMLLDSSILLQTNVSTLSVPLFYYSGRLLKVLRSRLNETYLNFGLIGSRKVKWLHFALLNTNPVTIELKEWGTNLTGATVEFVGVRQGNRSLVHSVSGFENLTNPSSMVLLPGQYGVFRVTVVAPKDEGVVVGEVFVRTQFELVAVATQMEVAHGDLQVPPDSLCMGECFPGKTCVLDLQVKSLFSRAMAVTGITSVPASSTVLFNLNQGADEALYIYPLTTSLVGDITFNPVLECKNECYLGTPENSAAASKWMNSLSLPLNTPKSDFSLFNTLYDRFLLLTSKTSWHNISVKIDTTEVTDFTFNVGVKLTWPKLILSRLENNSSVLEFPLTQIGNISYQNLSLTNPSSNPLGVQLVMEWVYLRDGKKVPGVPKRYEHLFNNMFNVTPGDFLVYNLEKASNRLQMSAHQETLTYILKPGETILAKIGFSPRYAGVSSALLFIRNNLTVLDVVKLTGRSAEAHFKFGNRKPGSSTPLLFELAKKHLKDCEREKNRKFPVPNLTVKRSFTARNTGEIPIEIMGFSINNLPCEGYGFRILNCDAFKLPPNGTRKIDIAFTPDFTLARIQRTLNIETSLGVLVNYTLITTLPPAFLASCSSVLARPPWEPLLYYSAISFMIFLLFCVLAAAFLESDRILKCALMAMARDRMPRPSECKPIYADVHKTLEKTSNKPTDSPEWSSHCHRQSDKPRDVGNVLHKTGSWTQPPERRFSSETEIKEQVTITQKFDDVDGTCPNTSSLHSNVRSKKKLGKRNSNNSDTCETMSELSSAKKTWGSVFSRSVNVQTPSGGKFKVPATVPEPEIKTNITQIKDSMVNIKKNQDSRKEVKRSNKCTLNKKIKPLPEPVLCSEEESSSSTTDSSNNDEMEKDRESSGTSLSERTHKATPKKAKGTPVDYRDNYEGDCDDDDYERDAHKRRWKPAVASPPEPSAKVEAPKPSSGLHLPFKLKANGTSRERKEKNGFKRTAEKPHPAARPAAPPEGAGGAARASPPSRPPSVWTESRASFSDVVSRQDGPSYSTVVAPRRPQPPRQQPPPPPGLGPIGPKRPPTSAWGGFVDPHQLTAHFLQQENNSLFANSFRDPQQAGPSPPPSSSFRGEPWARQGLAFGGPHEDHGQRRPDDLRQQHLFKESWPASLWDPLYTPAVGDAPTYSPGPGVAPPPQESPGSTFWWNSGGDPVWSPPAPEEPPLQTYDPFRSLNNIWTPQSSDPWANKPRNE